jgi:sulfur-carrier protein
VLHLLYFAWVREQMGKDGETIPLPGGVATVADLLGWLTQRGDTVFVETDRLRVAVNQTFASLDTAIASGDEIAIFPPVTGG